MCTKSFEQKNHKSEASLNYIARFCVNNWVCVAGGEGQAGTLSIFCRNKASYEEKV